MNGDDLDPDVLIRELERQARRDRDRADRAEADRDRLAAELGKRRMCVNCGRTKPVSEDRHEPLPECTGPDGYAACTFDMTPQEAWEHWRGEAHRLAAERDDAREEYRAMNRLYLDEVKRLTAENERLRQAIGLAVSALPDSPTAGPDGIGYTYAWYDCEADEQDWVKSIRQQIAALTEAPAREESPDA